MKYLITVVALILALSVSAWAQGGKPTTLAELAKYKGADRERMLYEGAKKEGKLTWYTSLVPNKHIAKVFQAKFPGVAVDMRPFSAGLSRSSNFFGTMPARMIFLL